MSNLSNSLQYGIISMIKSAVTGEKFALPENFDFSAATEICKKHHIQPIFYYGIINSEIELDEETLDALSTTVFDNILLSQRQAYKISCIENRFNEAGIDYMLLKGAVLKGLYPKPEMRTMSDADILVRESDFEKVSEVMTDAQYQFIEESDHELIWRNGGITIELHKRLIPSYNKDYYRYYGDGWAKAVLNPGTKHSFTFSNEDMLIYLFTHFSKHYRDGGIGIKHLVDLWLFTSTNKELDKGYIKNELQKLRLFEFYQNVEKTLRVWFYDAEEDSITKIITDTIFSSGAYGTLDSHVISSTAKISQKTGINKGTKLQKFSEMAFLPYKNMCILYGFLKKAPFLLPVMWVVRWINALAFRRNDIEFRKKNLSAISDEKVNGFTERLHLVGLDFDFKE